MLLHIFLTLRIYHCHDRRRRRRRRRLHHYFIIIIIIIITDIVRAEFVFPLTTLVGRFFLFIGHEDP